MTVNGINGVNTQAGQSTMSQKTDAVSKNLQKQISDAQKQLQEISSNQDLSIEEKMEKRQEIQKKIFDLQNQLRQHEMELRKEAQQAQSSEMDEMLGGKREPVEDKLSGGVSQAGMESMISADSALNQAKTQGNVAARLEGSAKVLEGEIKQDAGRGKNVEAKQGALSDIEQRVMQATASQANTLKEAAEKLESAATTERTGKTGTEEIAKTEAEDAEPKDIYVQYDDSVVVEISGEGIVALAESRKSTAGSDLEMR